MIFSRGKESTGGVAPSSMTKDHFSIRAYSLSIYSESIVFVRIPNTMMNQLLWCYPGAFSVPRRGAKQPYAVIGVNEKHDSGEETHPENW